MATLQKLLAALGGTAPYIQSASAVAVIVGGVYLADCRATARTPENIDRCYFTALPLMGIGIAGRGGFQAGYQTYNPTLRRPEDDAPPEDARATTGRDSHGRFTPRN